MNANKVGHCIEGQVPVVWTHFCTNATAPRRHKLLAGVFVDRGSFIDKKNTVRSSLRRDCDQHPVECTFQPWHMNARLLEASAAYNLYKT